MRVLVKLHPIAGEPESRSEIIVEGNELRVHTSERAPAQVVIYDGAEPVFGTFGCYYWRLISEREQRKE